MKGIFFAGLLFATPALASGLCAKSDVTAEQLALLKAGKVVIVSEPNPNFNGYQVRGYALSKNTNPRDVAAILFDYENYKDPFNVENSALKEGYEPSDNPKQVNVTPIKDHPLNQNGELYIPFTNEISARKEAGNIIWMLNTVTSPRIVSNMKVQACGQRIFKKDTLVTITGDFVGNPQIPFELLPMEKRLEIWSFVVEAVRIRTSNVRASAVQLKTLADAL